MQGTDNWHHGQPVSWNGHHGWHHGRHHRGGWHGGWVLPLLILGALFWSGAIWGLFKFLFIMALFAIPFMLFAKAGRAHHHGWSHRDWSDADKAKWAEWAKSWKANWSGWHGDHDAADSDSDGKRKNDSKRKRSDDPFYTDVEII